MKKILVVLTNVSQYGDKNIPTGLWLSEATEFVYSLSNAGFEIDYVTPKGTYVPIDPNSLKSIYINKEIMQVYSSEDFKERALSKSLKPEQIDYNDYIAIYYTGGHGVIWDFFDNKNLQKLTTDIYNNNGYIVSVCHGLVGLLNIKLNNNSYLISNKKVTGFTKTEEILSGKNNLIPFSVEDIAIERGAIFQKKRFFSSFSIEDSRIITGQNPMSVYKVAKMLINNIK